MLEALVVDSLPSPGLDREVVCVLCPDEPGRKLSPVFISSGRARPASQSRHAGLSWAFLHPPIKKVNNKLGLLVGRMDGGFTDYTLMKMAIKSGRKI